MKNVGIVGCGYWGKNLIRNFYYQKSLYGIFDNDPNIILPHIKNFQGLYVFKSLEEILNCEDIEGVVIATPAFTHYELAKKVLKSGKHVYVEKPFTLVYGDAQELVDLAKEKNKIIFVGMIYLYNSAIKKIKEMIETDRIGNLKHIHFDRLNWGKYRKDVDIVFNIVPHDLSIILYLLNNQMPLEVRAIGYDYIEPNHIDIAHISMKFSNNLNITISASWLHPEKVRRIILTGQKNIISYDDSEKDSIYIHNKHLTKTQNPDDISIQIERVSFDEPLRVECQHFLDCMGSNTSPITSGENNLKLMRILCAIEKSYKSNGSIVTLP